MAFSELKLPGLTKIDSLGLLKVDKIETASGFYDGVFEKMEDRLNLPVVTKHFVLMQNSRSDFEPILTLNNGDVFFGKTSVNNAEVYLFTSPFYHRVPTLINTLCLYLVSTEFVLRV